MTNDYNIRGGAWALVVDGLGARGAPLHFSLDFTEESGISGTRYNYPFLESGTYLVFCFSSLSDPSTSRRSPKTTLTPLQARVRIHIKLKQLVCRYAPIVRIIRYKLYPSSYLACKTRPLKHFSILCHSPGGHAAEAAAAAGGGAHGAPPLRGAHMKLSQVYNRVKVRLGKLLSNKIYTIHSDEKDVAYE